MQLINTLYYSDSTNTSEALDAAFSLDTGKQFWLQEAYADFLPTHASSKSVDTKTTEGQVAPSGPKVYLLKLIEFNKIELLERLDDGIAGGLAGPPYINKNNSLQVTTKNGSL